MRGINKVFLMGNLGGDPEAGVLSDGKVTSYFSVATNEKRPVGNGKFEDNTSWHNVKLFGPVAEIANKYLKKGSKVLVEGKINYYKKQNNDKFPSITYTNITGKAITLIDGPKKGTEIPF